MNLGRLLRRDSGRESLSSLHAGYVAGDDDDVETQVAVLERIVELYPDADWAWFNLGLYAKWTRDWPRAAEMSARSLELQHDKTGSQSAWNLGIAATALGNWQTARSAWLAYGLDLAPAPEDESISEDGGLLPIRLNPAPTKPGENSLLVDGQNFTSVVEWCQGVCPARARIVNVPLPESGHRFGDIVLHDNEPVGEARRSGSTRPYFNELERLVASTIPTLEVHVVAPEPKDVTALLRMWPESEFGAQDWTTSMHSVCQVCGWQPDAEHPPEPVGHMHDPSEEFRSDRRIGIAASFEVAEALLQSWVEGAPGRSRGNLTVAV